MSISDDDINSQPADDGLPPVVAGDADGTDGGDSDSTAPERRRALAVRRVPHPEAPDLA